MIMSGVASFFDTNLGGTSAFGFYRHDCLSFTLSKEREPGSDHWAGTRRFGRDHDRKVCRLSGTSRTRVSSLARVVAESTTVDRWHELCHGNTQVGQK